MSSARNEHERSSLNNNVTRMESPNSVPSVLNTSRPVNIIHGGTFHVSTFNFGSSIGSNSRSQSPHFSDVPLPNPNE